MLAPAERAAVADEFGVSDTQVRRDHLLSHLLIQRYTDAPPARLRVPTLAAFVAMKTAAWFDRGAARDLYDLHLLAGLGAIDSAARDLYARLGPTGRPPPAARLFRTPPTDAQWRDQVAAQTRLSITPTAAAASVCSAWADADRRP